MGKKEQAFASGPLRISKRNPRYFEDAEGRIVYLTGSHTGATLVDRGHADPPRPFDFPGFLAFLNRHNHNFIRMWTLEEFMDMGWPMVDEGWDQTEVRTYNTPLPWRRTGPGLGLDGKPKFDLNKYDPEYFRRLRERAALAGQQGIYVSIMLFEGWGQRRHPKPWRWNGHPFNLQNNVNAIDGDPHRTGSGSSVHSLDISAITALQEAYVRHVIDTVNDLDNVLYEISNEDGEYSKDWQFHLIRYIHEYEQTKPNQHPVGMTFLQMGSEEETNRVLFDSPAEWISPLGSDPQGPWRNDPPPSDGSKVIVSDTDHLWGIGGNVAWVWKSFCRGLNPIFMEIYVFSGDNAGTVDPSWDAARRSMGYTRMYSQRMNLAEAVPSDELASTSYCLSDKRNHFLIFLPESSNPADPARFLSVNLLEAPGLFNVEWLNPNTGEIRLTGQLSGGQVSQVMCPFRSEAVLYLWKPPAAK